MIALTTLALATLMSPQRPEQAPRTPTLGLETGTQWVVAPDYTLRLSKSTGVAISMIPGKSGFDFLPYDRRFARETDGFYHLGDFTFRARPVGSSDWIEGSTASHRKPISNLPVSGNTYAAHDLAATLPENSPLSVTRRWQNVNGRLALTFEVKNKTATPVEIGALGIPVPFNNIIMDRSLEEAHAKCSFSDPYIGADAGFLRVTRLDGIGPTMVVTPVGKTPFEAYHLLNEPMRPNQVFEGMMEWMVHTSAYAEREWKGVEQWNAPTSATLKPGETRTYGLEFTPSPSIRAIEDTVRKVGQPVAVGFPGYVVPKNETAKLFVNYARPVKSVVAEPAGSLRLKPNREGKNGWKGYDVLPTQWGRSRLTVTYADGKRQVISYYVIKSQKDAVADMGRFLTNEAWFTDKNDPFGRAPSSISYDWEAKSQVTQDSRVWIAGLGDEGGSGNWLALAMKEYGNPDPAEVAKLEAFVDGVMWGNLQFKEGPNKYGVRKSVFFYDPKVLPTFAYDKDRDWRSWTSWSKEATDDIGRGYNYPHVVAAYWSLYRIARNNPGVVKNHPWEWYLDQAYATTEFLTSRTKEGWDRVGYWRLGLMEGDVFVHLLEDLRREGWSEKANLIEARMKERADRWKDEAYPFGSEMAWDSTGQEEVYAWCKWFKHEDKAQVSLNSILAYDPTVPHWGYNGNARRYWDFLYGGKLSRIERQIHHYGSGMNAIPLLSEFREHPEDLYLLRVGYGGTMGALSNINEAGFASAAFHTFPSTLKWDAYSGDYGPNFFGHATNAGCYLVETKDFGWQAFGGEVSATPDGKVALVPTDSFRTRLYIAPAGLFLTLDAGKFAGVLYDPKTGSVKVQLQRTLPTTEWARLLIQTPGGKRPYALQGNFSDLAGAKTIPLGPELTTIELVPAAK